MELFLEVAEAQNVQMPEDSVVTMATVLAVGVCYYVRLSNTRSHFLDSIQDHFE